MTRIFAVTFDPGDGPEALYFVESETSGEAKQAVLKYLHSIDLDAVTLFDLRVQILGQPEGIYILDESGKVVPIKEDA